MKYIARRARSISGEATEIVLVKDQDNRRRTYTLESDGEGRSHLAEDLSDDFANPADERGPKRRRGRSFPFDENNRPRGAPIGPPDAKFIVHDLRPSRRGTYLVIVTRAADGRHGALELLAPPDDLGFTVAERDEEDFAELFGHAAMVPGKIAALLNDIKRGAPVTFPVELDNTIA